MQKQNCHSSLWNLEYAQSHSMTVCCINTKWNICTHLNRLREAQEKFNKKGEGYNKFYTTFYSKYNILSLKIILFNSLN